MRTGGANKRMYIETTFCPYMVVYWYLVEKDAKVHKHMHCSYQLS